MPNTISCKVKLKSLPVEISISDAKDDINEFFTKVEHIHPDLLAAMEPDGYLKLKKWVVKEISGKMRGGSVSVKDLAYALYYAAASFKDGHTNIRYYNDFPAKGIKAAHFPPFLLEFRNGAFYVRVAQDHVLNGAKLTLLNGVSLQDFARPIFDRCSAELFHVKGRNFTHRQRFWWAFSGLFSGRKTFNLEARSSANGRILKKLSVIDHESFDRLYSKVAGPIRESARLEFLKNRQTAYFRYPSFDNSPAEKRTIDTIFSQVKRSSAHRLIIDIRGNGGGDSAMADFIMKYLTDRPVRSYSKVKIKISKELLASPSYSREYKKIYFHEGYYPYLAY